MTYAKESNDLQATRSLLVLTCKNIDAPTNHQVRRAALKHLALVLRRDKQRLAELVLEGREVDAVVSRLLTGLLELSTGTRVKSSGYFTLFSGFGQARCSIDDVRCDGPISRRRSLICSD